jgi:hypothetical protein
MQVSVSSEACSEQNSQCMMCCQWKKASSIIFLTDCYCWSLSLFAIARTFTWRFVINSRVDREKTRYCYLMWTYVNLCENVCSYLQCSKLMFVLYTITALFLCQYCWYSVGICDVSSHFYWGLCGNYQPNYNFFCTNVLSN